VRRIVVNTAIDSIRKAKRAPILKDNDNDFKVEASNEIEENEKIELIELRAEKAVEAIQKLSPAYRTVFNLFVIEDYSHKEIAEMLGISEGTSKSNLSKAKKNLKQILTEEFSNIRE
jgi:RNA polymerase sigma-70 factor (ECF subfamily)